MLRALASLFFYGRFLRPFSRIGLRERQQQWSELPRLDGQCWLVSGASGGIGAAIVRGAIARGARVIAVARSADKLAALRAQTGAPERFVAECCDLASLTELRALLQRLSERGERIDVLLNNVGVLLNDYQQTSEGFESSFVSNLLGHYLLTEGLRKGHLFAADAAVINMASGGMYGARLDLAKLNAASASDFDGMAAYAQHKRAQVELTRYWNGQWQGEPKVYVMHPGWVDTDGVKRSLPWFRATLKRYLRSTDEGADTALWLGATRPPPPAEGIWLDRVLDPEHVFAISRGGASADELAAFLADCTDRGGKDG
jgi:dehydrogenase/reductase SDR family protein 12